MSQLSTHENSAFERAITIFRPSRAVLNQANNLLHLFLQHQDTNPEVIPCMADIATFIAQSSQQIRDLKGRKISGMGLTFSRLIGNCLSIPLLIQQISKFISVVHLEPQYKLQIENYVYKAKATYQFMQLFQSYMNKLQLIFSQNIGNLKYKQIFVQFAWILYIDARQNCIKTDSDAKQQNNCLMASVFYFMIRYSLQYLYPKGLKLDRNAQKRSIIAKILQFLLNTFQIEQIDLYMKVADRFDEYIQILINCQLLKSVGFQTDFFSPVIIHLNFKQLQNKYQKKLQPKDIDYRVFRKQKSLTPIHKEALFHRAGIKKFPTLSKSMTTQYRSHRALNYEELESPKQFRDSAKSKTNPQAPHAVLPRSNNQFHIKKNPQFKLHHSTSLIVRPSTYVPEGIYIEIYRYINTLTKASKRSHKSLFYEKSLVIIQDYLSKISLSNLNIHKKSLLFTIYSVYVSLSEKIFDHEYQTESMHQCLISIAIYIGLQMYELIGNQKTISDIYNQFKNNNYIDLWYCMNFLDKNDEEIPIKLLNTLSNQKQHIICDLIWRNNLYIDQIAELAANYQKNSKFLAFTQKLIQYCENFLKQISEELQVSDEHCLYAYNCIKFILSANGNVLENQNLDQILMCCLYIAGKTLNSPILFLNIKESYEILFRNKNRDLEAIFNKVVVNQNGIGDIIYFYNKNFVQNIKPFVPYMANPSLSLLHHLFQREIAFERQNYPINMLNIMETTKPKSKKLKHKNSQTKSDGLGIIIQAQRNETRVRIRPHNSMHTQLYQTQKIKKPIDSQEEENFE